MKARQRILRGRDEGREARQTFDGRHDAMLRGSALRVLHAVGNPAIASDRSPSSPFDTHGDFMLRPNERFLSDGVQFRLANLALLARLKSDPAYRAKMLKDYPNLKNWEKNPNPLADAPKGLTWHHNEAPGKLQLVDHKDHRDNHSLYHPNGEGGRSIWGGGKPGRKGQLDSKGRKLS